MSKKKINYAIYSFYCKGNKKYYVGLDSYFPERKHHHLHLLRQNLHKNVYLQRAFNKYEENSFVFELIEKCNSVNQMKKREAFHIKRLDSFKNGFNCSLGGESCSGRIQSPEEILKRVKKLVGKKSPFKGKSRGKKFNKKIGKILKNKKYSREKRPVLQFDIYGKFIKEFPSINNASRNTGIPSTSICQTCKNFQKTGHGFIWKYKN